MTAIFGIDYTTLVAFAVPTIIGAVRGYKWYREISSRKGAIQADVHAFRLLVDDVDASVQAGTVPPDAAVEKIWSDVLHIKDAVKATAAPVVAPTTAPTPPAA